MKSVRLKNCIVVTFFMGVMVLDNTKFNFLFSCFIFFVAVIHFALSRFGLVSFAVNLLFLSILCVASMVYLYFRYNSLIGRVFLFLKGLFGVFLSAAAIFVFGIVAKNIFLATVGLPPSGFFVTITLISIVVSIFVFVVFMLVFLLLSSCVIFTWRVLVSLIGSLIPSDFVLFLLNFNSFIPVLSKFKDNCDKKFLDAMSLFAVGVFVSLGGLYVCQALIELILSEDVIKKSAYYFDYVEVDNYPCIDLGSRVIFHENGVVSVATLDGDKVNIKVGFINPSKVFEGKRSECLEFFEK